MRSWLRRLACWLLDHDWWYGYPDLALCQECGQFPPAHRGTCSKSMMRSGRVDLPDAPTRNCHRCKREDDRIDGVWVARR